jgi:N-acyl-phosphatidylethanolamine-hydrolysing phospholipase D
MLEAMTDPILALRGRSHHHPRGGFRNPWPASEPHGITDLLKWTLSRQRSRPTEESSEPMKALDRVLESPGDGLSITWIGHSTFLIQSEGMTILTDPIWSDRASPVQFAGPRRHRPPGLTFDSLASIDAIFISHDHYDHLDAGTIDRLIDRFPHAKWLTPVGVGHFLRKRGAIDISEKDWWQSENVGRFSAFCTPAMHFSGRYPWNRNSTLWAGWVIEIGSHRVFFAGDTGLHPEFAEIARRFGPFDAAILPIGAYEPRWFMRTVHMNPEDAVSAYLQIVTADDSGACVFIPSHWGTFRLTDEPLDEPPRRLSNAWLESTLPEDRLWLLRHGETKALG